MVIKHKCSLHEPVCSSVHLNNKDHSYNGWSNYETWATNLWIGEQEVWSKEVARIILRSKDQREAADRLQEMIEESPNNLQWFIESYAQSSLVSGTDLYKGFNRIDWLEIVEFWWNEDNWSIWAFEMRSDNS